MPVARGCPPSMEAADPTVRTAGFTDLTAIMNVLDGADLAAEADTIRDRIADGSAMVASVDDTIVGALVYRRRGHEIHVEAVAVRRRSRDRGIGTALVETAARRGRTITADFDPGSRPFYAALGFDIESTSDDRLRGIR